MTGNYKTFGTLALKPYDEGHDGTLIVLDRFLGHGEGPKSDVERVLDDFEGAPLAKTASERRFAAVALAVAGLAMLFFSFAPIF